MSPSPFLIRRLLASGLLALFGFASPSLAQGADPFENCKSSTTPLSFKGPAEGSQSKGKVTGEVVIDCSGTQVFAEEISWDLETIYATGGPKGDVLVIQDGLRINADRVEMNRKTRLGVFFKAYGTARLTDTPPAQSLFGTMEPQVWFQGERIERTGPRSYKLTNGSFSTCVQPNPRWVMVASSATIVLDEHAILKNAQFRVKGVPVLYVPYLYYPLNEEDRSSGFLMPTYSTSAVRGQGLSNAFFWAINRSQDATFYHDYFSKAGQGGAVDYRYAAAPGSQGNLRVYGLWEEERLAPDGSVERAERQSYEVRGAISQSLGRAFWLTGEANYFSDISTQQLYQQNTYDLSNRSRKINLTLTGNISRLSLTGVVERNDVFTDTTPQGRSVLPQVKFTLRNAAIGRSKIYYGASGEIGSFELRDPNAAMTEVGVRRLHGQFNLSGPLTSLEYLRVTTGASWQATRWLDSLDPLTGLPVPVPINRNLLNLRAEVAGPILERLFQTPENGYAERFKHRIEPRVSVSWLSAFDQRATIIQVDQLDRPVAGSTTLNYALSNVISAGRRVAGGGRSNVRPILSFDIDQSYYTDSFAGTVDPQFPSGVVGHFSPIRLTAQVAPADDIRGRFQVFIDPDVYAVRSYSATGIFRVTRLDMTASWSKTQYLPGIPGYDNPDGPHSVGATATITTTDRRFGGTYGFNVDVTNRNLVQQRIVAYYNAQCCGISLDYQVTGVSQFQLTNVPVDRRFAISFTLAGIGSFSYPFGGFGQ